MRAGHSGTPELIAARRARAAELAAKHAAEQRARTEATEPHFAAIRDLGKPRQGKRRR